MRETSGLRCQNISLRRNDDDETDHGKKPVYFK